MSATVVPFSLRNAPALIERILPVQKLSAESYKEQVAVQGKTLTGLGSYWKGRKPLILNKACILGCLLPATDNAARDLEIFEMLLGMDVESLEKRLEVKNDKESRFILGQQLSVGHNAPYKAWVQSACRAEECGPELFDHIWNQVNAHLGTNASSTSELIEQLGLMRFGRRPILGDTFSGSGQIPFEAARLGCDVVASDLNPVACMLTWGSLNIVGGSETSREALAADQQQLVLSVQAEIDRLGVETDGMGWRPKAFLYCVEVRCPQSGWTVPLLPNLVVSASRNAIAELVPDAVNKRYEVRIRTGVSAAEMNLAETGTIGREGKYGEAFLVHRVGAIEYKTKISTLRGDFQTPDGAVANRLRLWGKRDFKPRPDDIFQERLYCVQWTRPKRKGKGYEHDFRSVDASDMDRERVVEAYVSQHIVEWQENGWIPDMRIEVGGPPRYQGLDLVRARGWTHWHHLFTPRQLLMLGLSRKGIEGSGRSEAALTVLLARLVDWSSKLCRYGTGAARESISQTFYNQALNTLFNYGVRPFEFAKSYLLEPLARSSIRASATVCAREAKDIRESCDLFVTDPPYGNAVKYEEILDFFIAWLRKNPPREFVDWVWDSRRSLAIQGEGEDFRRGMVAAYKRMTECMPSNGIQVIMFTHQSGSIWADMANIVWASGLQVTAAWYVVTETDSALREGSYVKGTVLLVLRKRQGNHKTTRDDLAWEIQEEVEKQVDDLTGLNQQAKGLYRDENVFEDADIQMAGYAAALRVLTRYAVIDGRDMTAEAIRPRLKSEATFVDGLIVFAVDTANQCLVPQGIVKSQWDRLSGADRFYLKMIDMEARGAKTLDNYQNFAKAFKVRDFKPLLSSHKANEARLKSALDFGRGEMGEGSELYQSTLRAALYAVMELQGNVDGAEVLAHLTLNVPNYYSDMTQRELVAELAEYLAKRLDGLRPDEASAARVLCELVKNQRLG
jgi:putative DNA methylase